LSPIVASLRNLKSLTLRDSPLLSDAALTALTSVVNRRRCLTELDLSGCRKFTDETLWVLLGACGGVLRSLDLSRCRQLTDLGLMGLRARGHRTNLRSCNLSGIPRATETGVGFLCEGVGRSKAEGVEKARMEYLFKLKRLKRLNLADNALGNNSPKKKQQQQQQHAATTSATGAGATSGGDALLAEKVRRGRTRYISFFHCLILKY